MQELQIIICLPRPCCPFKMAFNSSHSVQCCLALTSIVFRAAKCSWWCKFCINFCAWLWHFDEVKTAARWMVFGFPRRNIHVFRVICGTNFRILVWGQVSHGSQIRLCTSNQIHTSQMATEKLLAVTDCSNTSEVKELLLHPPLQSVKLLHSHEIGLIKGLLLVLRGCSCRSIFSPRYFSALKRGDKDGKKNLPPNNSPSGKWPLSCDGLLYGDGVQCVFPSNPSVILLSKAFCLNLKQVQHYWLQLSLPQVI